jgi:hypothetical protein
MRRRPVRWSAAPIALAASLVLALLAGSSMLPATGQATNPKANRFAPSGVVAADPDAAATAGAATARAQAAAADAPGGGSVPGPSVSGTSGCNDTDGTNVRVNQECTNQSGAAFLGRGQGQNETAVAVNPKNPRHLLAGQNDYRRGDGACGADWSYDGGRRWGSELAPLSFTAPGFTGARHYWDASGDPSVAFDSSGEAYLFCLAFNRGAPVSDAGLPASGLFVFRSANGGASWNFPASPVKLSDGTGDDGIGLLDKPYMAADTGRNSRFRDRLYVAWAEYNVDFTADPIGFAWSDDHGATWNLVPAISGTSAALCPVNFDGSPAGTCNANQFPQPFTAPNGDLYVVFQNFNNAVAAGGDNHNQILIVKSTDGGESFGPPVKVSDFNDLPDCLTYTGHDAGRACVPTAPLSDRSIFRATNYPSAVATSNNRIVVSLGSYINRHSNPTRGNCTPAGFSATTGLNLYTGVGERNGCNNDIVVSVSDDGGASFTGTTTPVAELPSLSDERPGGQLADQFWQWAALNPKTGRVTTAYYDRKYGDDQQTGEMDITLRRGNGSHVRVTNRSLPPTQEFPEAGASTGIFVGDYMGVAVGSDGMAHPVWTDTRNPIFSPSTGGDVRELVPAGQGTDIYTRSLPG